MHTWAIFIPTTLLITSAPGSRKTHRAGKYEGYFGFKQLKLSYLSAVKYASRVDNSIP